MMADQADGSAPILCAHLLRRVDEELINLLLSLAPCEWDLQTMAPLWKVRDVAAHLLDTALRKLSMVRDSCYSEALEMPSPQDLIALVNRLNQEGVTVYRRLSPAVLIGMLKIACQESASFHESLDPFAPAAFNVSWAGETESLNWFDTARELTERWHHQQQIRLATKRPGIMTPDLYHPVLDCFLRGLPHLYRDVEAPAGTVILVKISGQCGGQWVLSKGPDRWAFAARAAPSPVAQATIPQELAWRLFTKGLDPDSARAQVEIEGNRNHGERILHLTAIVGQDFDCHSVVTCGINRPYVLSSHMGGVTCPCLGARPSHPSRNRNSHRQFRGCRKIRAKRRRQRLDAGKRRARPHDDRPRPGPVLWRLGAAQERAEHHDAQLHPDGGR